MNSAPPPSPARALVIPLRAVSVLLVAAASAGCTTGPGEAAPATRLSKGQSASAFPSTSSAEVAGREAVGVYLGMWTNMARAAETSDWRSPLLAEFATGEALTTLSAGLFTDSRNGVVTRGRPRNDPKVVEVAPAEAPAMVRLSDCGDSTNWLKYRVDTGELANDGPGGRRSITAVVTKQADGVWRVSDFAVQAVGTC